MNLTANLKSIDLLQVLLSVFPIYEIKYILGRPPTVDGFTHLRKLDDNSLFRVFAWNQSVICQAVVIIK